MRRTVPVAIALIGIIASLPVGCASDGPDYFPLSDGARWEYAIQFANPGQGTQTATAVTRIDGQETIQGNTYWKMVTVMSGVPGAEPSIEYMRKTDDGVYVVTAGARDEPEHLSVRLPLVVGATWQLESPALSAECRVAARENAELLDRTYEDCFKVSCTGESGGFPTEMHGWYAPGVGVVRIGMKSRGTAMDFVLESYSP